MSDYVLRADRLLAVAHIRDPQVAPCYVAEPDPRYYGTGASQLSRNSHSGRTICGLPLLVDEQWQPWTDITGVKICPGCEAGTAAFVEEMLL